MGQYRDDSQRDDAPRFNDHFLNNHENSLKRKRNVDLTKIPGLGKIQEEGVLSNLPTVNDPSSITLIQEDNSDRKSEI